MKICMIVPSLIGGGVERVVINLSSQLIKMKHEVHIVMFKNIIGFDLDNNIKLHILKEKKATELKELIANIEKDGKSFDYIYAHSLDKIVKNAKLKNRYYIIHGPISIRLKKGLFLSRIVRKIKFQHRFKNENIITVSNGVKKDFIMQNFKMNFIKTIYNPFNFEQLQSLANKEDIDIPKDDYIINVARFHHFQKRHDILLKAFSKCKLSCKLLLVGKGPREETNKIKSLIKKLNLEEQVILIGFKTNPFPLMKNAKLFVLSSDFEGFGMVLVESLILNTPVVSTNCHSGPSEIMIDNLSDYLVPVGNVDALAKKMYEAFYTPPIINQANLERFKAENIAKEYLALKNIHD